MELSTRLEWRSIASRIIQRITRPGAIGSVGAAASHFDAMLPILAEVAIGKAAFRVNSLGMFRR
jgi:hypothetical protein